MKKKMLSESASDEEKSGYMTLLVRSRDLGNTRLCHRKPVDVLHEC